MPEPEDEQVRRLLADARHTDPVPTDVAARLDRVLADLSREDELAAARAERVAGDARRTRLRRARGLLVAAAAVVAVGAGGSWVAQHRGADSDASSSGAADSASAPDEGGSTASEAAPSAGAPGPQKSTLAGLAPVRLTAAGFPRQVDRLLADHPQAARSADSGTPGFAADAAGKRCARPGWGRGLRVAATYDGAPAVLVVRPVRDGTRVVDLYACGGREPERSVTVPVR